MWRYFVKDKWFTREGRFPVYFDLIIMAQGRYKHTGCWPGTLVPVCGSSAAQGLWLRKQYLPENEAR